jgi:hypothetical protein
MLKFMCGVIVGATISAAYAQDVSQQLEQIKKDVTTAIPNTPVTAPMNYIYALAHGKDAGGHINLLTVNEDGSVNCAK